MTRVVPEDIYRLAMQADTAGQSVLANRLYELGYLAGSRLFFGPDPIPRLTPKSMERCRRGRALAAKLMLANFTEVRP